MAWIDETYVDNLADTNVIDALFTDVGGSSVNSSARTAAIAAAEALVGAYIAGAGYTVPGTNDTVPEVLKFATFGAFLIIAYGGRKDMQIPESFATYVNMLGMIRDGELSFSSIGLTARDAVGGVSFSDTSETLSTGRPPVFSRSKFSTL